MTSQQPPNTPPGQWPGYPPPPTPPGQWPGYPPAGAPGQPWAQYLDPYARRKTPKRTYVYLALWITGVAFLAFTIIIGGYSTYTLQTRTARTDATIAREVPEAGRSHGYATTYTWVVDGITYSGYQTRTDKHYWSDPPFVCYNPGDPGQGTLAWPDRQDCSSMSWGPVVWIENIVLLGLLLGGTALAFKKWRKWRRFARLANATPVSEVNSGRI